MNLESLLDSRRIVVTLGPGGVGKTTVAAMLGLQAVVRGTKTLVLTIDPAMRLAEAMGLRNVAPGDHRVLAKSDLQRRGIPARADLTVGMLDTGRSLAALIEREVSSAQHRDRILQHPFFLRLSQDLAGAREYAAMEEIQHLYLHGHFDLLVVDTPPTTNSLDFLQAPDRVLNVLEGANYRWLMRPALLAGKLGLRTLDFSGGYVVRTLSRFTGLSFLKELATFIDLFSSLLEGFRERADAFRAILRSEVAAFVLVTTADPNQVAESFFLHRRLASRDLTPRTVVVNRLTPRPPELPEGNEWREALEDALDESGGAGDGRAGALLPAMEAAHRMLSELAARDQAHLVEIRNALGLRSQLTTIPMLDADVHDLIGLEKMRRIVFEEGGSV